MRIPVVHTHVNARQGLRCILPKVFAKVRDQDRNPRNEKQIKLAVVSVGNFESDRLLRNTRIASYGWGALSIFFLQLAT